MHHAHTHTHYTYTHILSCTQSLTRVYTLTLVHTHTHTVALMCTHTHTLTAPARCAQALPLFVDNEHVFMDLEQKLSKYFSKDWKRETRGVSQHARPEAGLLALKRPHPPGCGMGLGLRVQASAPSVLDACFPL